MKRILRNLVILILVGTMAIFGFLFAYSKTRGGGEDLKRLGEYSRLFLFRHGIVKSLDEKEIYRLYQQKCYRKCHGEAVMITAVLPPAGWMQIVERMRVQQGAIMTGKEANMIIRYLDLKYPANKSSIPYRVRREINRLLWKNDIGYGDLYVDVIYGTDVYFDSINARNLMDEYGVHENIVFVIGFTVHDGKVKHYPLEKMAFLKIGGKEYASVGGWLIRIETADGHHYEGVLRFPKKGASGKDILSTAKNMKLILRNLETSQDRVYQWDFPIPYPKEYENTSKAN